MNDLNKLYNDAISATSRFNNIHTDKKAFENYIINFKNEVENIARILCIDSNDFYDNILIKKNAISYDMVRDIAHKVEFGLTMSEEDFRNYDIMLTAYDAGALIDEGYAVHILCLHFSNEENMKKFRKMYCKIEECSNTCRLSMILRRIIECLDSTDATINLYLKDKNMAMFGRNETMDVYKEFISFGSHHLLTSFIQDKNIELDNVIYMMEELYAMLPFIREYTHTGKIDSPFIHFIIRRIERFVDIDALDIFTKIEGYSQINHQMNKMKDRLTCPRYDQYVPFDNLGFFNYFGKQITVEMLTEVENVLIAEKTPCLEIVDDYDNTKRIMNCKTQNDIVRICEAFVNMTVSSTKYANYVIDKMNRVNIGRWFDLVNAGAYILELYDALEKENIVTPLKELVEHNLNLVALINEPLRPYSAYGLQEEYSLDDAAKYLNVFIESFNKIDFEPYGLSQINGEKQNNASHDEEIQDPNKAIVELLLKLGMIDDSFYIVDNAVLILSEYLPAKHAILYNSEITLEDIVKYMDWKCDNAKMCLISELKWVLWDEDTMRLLKEFITISGNLLLFVDDMACELNILSDLEGVRNVIKNSFLEIVKEKEIRFFDYINDQNLDKRIDELFKQGFIVRSGKEVTKNINCCMVVGTLCNAYIERCYRKGILKTYNRLVSALYGFCVGNESQIIDKLTKKQS